MTKTEEVLAEMLTENVGSHFLDSGGSPQYDETGKYIGSSNGYGRNFEINRGREFDKEEASVVKFKIRSGELEIELVHNLYHWLKSRLELDETLDSIFHGQFLEQCDSEDKSWFELVNEFPKWVSEHVTSEGKVRLEESDHEEDDEFLPVAGLCGHGNPIQDNSYNHENLLSQDICYCYFTRGTNRGNREVYVILMIHGGADIRGGYTKPRVFHLDHDEEYAPLDFGNGSIHCTRKHHHPKAKALKDFQEKQLDLPGVYVDKIDFDCHTYWNTTDGYHFDTDLEGNKITEFEVVDLDEDGTTWEPGKLCIQDGKAYCPYCGALLGGGFY